VGNRTTKLVRGANVAALENEQRVVSKVVQERTLIPALQRGINESWFLDDDNRKIWSFIRQHYNEYNEVPSAIVIAENYPNYKLLDPASIDDTLDYMLDKMVTARRALITRQGLEASVEHLRSYDYDSVLIEMERTVTRVNEQGVLGTNEVDLSENVQERYTEYKALGTFEFLGIPTGFEQIDEATGGLQGGQLITVIAPPKTGKSQIALKIAVNVHKQGYIPMFQSFEMSNREIQQRHDAMRANVSHGRLRRGKLLPKEETRYIDSLNEIETMQPFITIDAVGGLTVSALAAKIQQNNPDIIFVDGVYLMLDEVSGEMNTPQALTNITRALKRLAQRVNKPIIITTQTLLWKMRAGRVTADSIGYSSSFFQDSDVILGLEPCVNDAGNEQENLRTLRIVASRNCPPTDSPIIWNWDTSCFHDEAEESKCAFCNDWNNQ
jgi:replicative DNA helicase